MRDFLLRLANSRPDNIGACVIGFPFFLLSLIYGLIVRTLIFYQGFKQSRLSCKTISVGNITVGGTGKTVLVEYIARYLKKQGRKTAIISRGYGRNPAGCEGMGDEPYMLKKNLKDVPVIVDANRLRGARRATGEYKADTVILDDGFQQWGIVKDLEIVTVDSSNPFGNKQMLPRGILREPLSSLKRADVFVLTKAPSAGGVESLKLVLNKLNPKSMIIESTHEPAGFYDVFNPEKCFGLETLKGKTVTLFSGIGDPASFENLIARMEINVGLSFRFPDHHCYSQSELDKIIQASEGKDIAALITTEKDAVRLLGLPLTAYRLPLLALRVKLELKNEQVFLDRLLKLYSL